MPKYEKDREAWEHISKYGTSAYGLIAWLEGVDRIPFEVWAELRTKKVDGILYAQDQCYAERYLYARTA